MRRRVNYDDIEQDDGFTKRVKVAKLYPSVEYKIMVMVLVMVLMPTASPSLTFVLMVVSRAARGVPSTW